MQTFVGILFLSLSTLSVFQIADKPIIKSQTEKVTKFYSGSSESYLTNKRIYSKEGALLEEIFYSHSGLEEDEIKNRNLYTYDSLGREVSRKTFYKNNPTAHSLRTIEYGNRIGGGTYEKTYIYSLDSFERIIGSIMSFTTYFNSYGKTVACKMSTIDGANELYASLRVYNFDEKGNTINEWYHWDESTFIEKVYETKYDDEGKIISRKGLYPRCGSDLILEKWQYNPDGSLSYRMTENANASVSHLYYSYNSSGKVSEQTLYRDNEKFVERLQFFYNPFYPEKLARVETYRDERMTELAEIKEISFSYFENTD